jgi:hypothetical protein
MRKNPKGKGALARSEDYTIHPSSRLVVGELPGPGEEL